MAAMPWVLSAIALMIGVQLVIDGRRAFRVVGLLVSAVALLLVLATILR